MNQRALITGASTGIGYELAKLFAADGWDLVLVARNQKRLEELAAQLKAQHRVDAFVFPKDLAKPNAAAEIFDALGNRPVTALVNNAGFGNYGPFAESALRVQIDMMQVNMRALVELTHLCLAPMLKRGSGRILNVASTAAFQPGPTVDIYYASKAFVYSFSYALAVELAGTGVTVTTLCPGTTRTEFFDRAHLQMAKSWPMMDAGVVARIGYRGFLKGQRVVIPGTMNRIASFFAKRMPVRLTSAVVRELHAPR
jgi:short-subunit dehydrogenase